MSSKIKLKKGKGLVGEDIFLAYIKPKFPNDEGIRSFSTIPDLVNNLKFWQIQEVALDGFSDEEKVQINDAGITWIDSETYFSG